MGKTRNYPISPWLALNAIAKKGTDIGSRKNPKGKFIRLFNPRTDIWHNHFELNWAIVRPKTDIGEITVKMLGFNDDFRMAFREYLMLIGIYP